MAAEMSSPTAVGFSLTMRECGLQSNSCAALRACALRGANPDACAGRGKQGVVGFCDVDGRALTCWHEQMLAVRDCPRGGEQCIVVDGQATCTLGPCPGGIEEGDKPRCSASGTPPASLREGQAGEPRLRGLRAQVRDRRRRDGRLRDGGRGVRRRGEALRRERLGRLLQRPRGARRLRRRGADVRVDAGKHARRGLRLAGPAAGGRVRPADRGKCDGANVKYCDAGKPRALLLQGAGLQPLRDGRGRCSLRSVGLRRRVRAPLALAIALALARVHVCLCVCPLFFRTFQPLSVYA